MNRVIILAGISCIAACGTHASSDTSLPPVTVLSSDSANHLFARVSPDGSRFYWWQPSGQGFQLWTSAADLKNPVKVPVTSVGPSQILWSDDGSQIAVTSSDSSLADVAVIPAAGGVPRRVTHSAGFAIPLGWNPDGDRVAFGASVGGTGGGTYQMFVVSIARGGMTPLIPGETRPYFGGWSPDGSHIGFVPAEGTRTTVWVADSAGRNPRQLTTDGFELVTSDIPWSPDGKWIAYESKRTGTSDIWIVPIDSGSPRQLTHDIRNDRSPFWSPDGKWIAFISDRGKQTDVWVVPAAGGPEIRVTNDLQTEELVGWLPGHRLAFLTGQAQRGVWSLSLADSAARRLTPDSMLTGSPQLSPDGSQIAFRIDHGGGVADIAVMPASGGAMRILVQGGSDSTITWSPDGKYLAFISDRSGTGAIWIADISTGALRQVENWSGVESQPTWSGDGSDLYFVSDHDSKIADIWKVPAAGGEPVRVTKLGVVNNMMTRRGRPELFAGIVNATGKFEIVQVMPDGSTRTAWNRTNAFPIDLTPKGDSLFIVESPAGGGGYTFRLIPVTGGGDGKVLLHPGEGYSSLSDDGTKLLYTVPNGPTADLGLLNRADGTTRRLTNTSTDEQAPVLTPDGKTVLFRRVRPSRRIAIADLSKLLGGAAH